MLEGEMRLWRSIQLCELKHIFLLIIKTLEFTTVCIHWLLFKKVIYIISLWRMFSVRIMPFWIRYFFKHQSEKVLNILSTFRYFPLLVVSPDWCNSQIFLNWFIVEYQIVWADFTLNLWTLWCETTKSFGKSV